MADSKSMGEVGEVAVFAQPNNVVSTSVIPDLAAQNDGIGRVKAPPVCIDSTLQKEAMSTEVLRQWVFSAETFFPVRSSTATTVVSSSSSVGAGWGGSSWSRSSIASTGTVTAGIPTLAPLPESVTTTGLPTEFAPPNDTPIVIPTGAHERVPVSVVSVSSNNSCAGDSHALSSDEMADFITKPSTVAATSATATPSDKSSATTQPPPTNGENETSSSATGQLNARVLLRKTSRQGRSTQRWLTQSPSVCGGGSGNGLISEASGSNSSFPHNHLNYEPLMRLVTGCVPILRCGKILFVSASRKSAWILPKGGWEQDETMEESAVRECFEEAGCIGTLGPPLHPIQHETRKAKKRRLEQETFLDQHEKSIASETSLPKDIDAAVVAAPKSGSRTEDAPMSVANVAVNAVDTATAEGAEEMGSGGSVHDGGRQGSGSSSPPSAPIVLSAEALSRIRQFSAASIRSGHHTDNETMSVGSTISTTYTHVQMTLFPLYVQKIEDVWPEKGRFRKAVDIDEAIAMLENRPELQAALQEVKDRGLHIVPEETTNDRDNATTATLLVPSE